MMAPTITLLVASVAVILKLAAATVGSGNSQFEMQESIDTKFGECHPEKPSCQECYLRLVRAVLGRDDNVHNLSQAFTPPTFDQPKSVIVNYHVFNCSIDNGSDSCVDEIHTWFWAKSGAYLLHPLATFQLISLLFGNAESLYEREVYVTLDATECYDYDPNHMTLLTQRLKIYIQQQSLNPQMTDAYIPVAANSTNLMELFNNSYYTTAPLSSEHVLFACPIIATFLVLTIMVVLVVLYAMPCGGVYGLKTRGKTGIKNQHKATIVAVSIISFNRIVIFIVYDILALQLRHPCSYQKVAAVCEFSQQVYDTPRVLLISDSVAGSLSVLLFITVVVFQILANTILKSYQSENKFFRDLKYFLLIGIALLFVFSCLMHTPYITMAYLSDAHYATSILVYYMTILFVEFGMIQFVFRICYDSRVPLILTEKKCKLCCLYSVTIALVISLILLLYGIVVCVSLFYYYLPVNNAISNLPNEGLVVYQTVIILLGAYITYKALIRVQKKNKYVQTISRQVKENEIALLSTEIEYMTLEASEKENRRKRILLLQKEIQLEYIQSNMMCLVDEPDSLINRRKVAHLYHQWNKIFRELKEEVGEQKVTESDDNSKIEIYRLQNELLHHLNQLHRLTEEQRSVDIKKDLNDKILESKKAILTNDDNLPSHEKNKGQGKKRCKSRLRGTKGHKSESDHQLLPKSDENKGDPIQVVIESADSV